MRIIQLLPELKVGGVERGTVDLSDHLIKLGHDSAVISAGGQLVDLLNEHGAKHYELPIAKKNIRVNTVAPTFVETPMVKKFFKNKKFKKFALEKIPVGKAATESDVATAVCFLASSASSMITGTSIIIDGGWTAQ